MCGVLIVLTEKDEIVYRQIYDNLDESEYCKIIIFLYGCIDILSEEMKSTNKNFFDCIETFEDRRVSAYIIPSGYKLMFIHKYKDVRNFLEELRPLIVSNFINKLDREEFVESLEMEEMFTKIYREYFCKN